MKSGPALVGMLGVGVVTFILGYQTGKNSQPQNGPKINVAPTAANNNNNNNAPKPAAAPAVENTVYKVPVGDAPCQGPADAKVTIIEYSDFQCPFCSRVVPTIKQVHDTYGNDVRICFKQNPLPFHSDAPLAATASLAAGDQGKFWDMHDALFANQNAIKRPDLEASAAKLGLNLDKFKNALDQNPYKARIDADTAEAANFGARGTPSFFVNGKALRGAQPFDAFKGAIDAAIKDADALIAQGTPRGQVYEKLIAAGLTKAAPPPPQQAPPPATRQAVTLSKAEQGKSDTCKGAEHAKVTIIEYSDFQCPFCSRVVPTLKQIADTWPKDVRVCFRQNPLPFHSDAPLAAEASLAAADQGKFWAMHDALFANQAAIKRPDLEATAAKLGLNMDKFKAALDNNAHKAIIDDNMATAAKFGARGTPGFFVNGTPLSGAQPFEAFKAAIEKELATADDLIKKGTPLAKVYEEALKMAPPPSAAPAAEAGPDPKKVYPVNVGSAYVKGNPKAAVTIIEYSDFQCPFCGRVGPTLKQVSDTYGDKVRIAFKHSPLPFHSDAPLASKAALAAGKQGKFWEMHDKLFANQSAIKRDNLLAYAKELALDGQRFEKDMDNPELDDVIKKDQAEGSANGANGTPTFFINGRQLVGAQPFEEFKKVIDEELAKKKG